MFGLLSSINYQTISMLAIVCGLVVLCLGMWYLWTTQQQMQTDLQFMQMQCTQLAATSTPTLPSSSSPKPSSCAASDNGTCALPSSLGNTPALDSVLHRSMALMQAANDAQHPQQQGTHNNDDDDDAEDDEDDDSESCSDDYDDDDTAVSETLVPQTHNNNNDNADDATTLLPVTDASATVSDANLVESLLSNIVTETIDAQMQHEPSPPQAQPQPPAPTSDASAEDFITNQGDPSKLAATLQQKTVNELKKICAEYQIGTKKGKGYKRKDELIDDIVKVKVGAGALE